MSLINSEGVVDAVIKTATESDPNNEKSDFTIFSYRYDESDRDINLRHTDLEVQLLLKMLR